jgi:hypothetical protein
MKQRLYITGEKSHWDGKVTLRFSTDPDSTPYAWQLPLGAIEVDLPYDFIPNDDTWNAMSEKHKIVCAKHKITEAQVVLRKAEEELKTLLCIEHNE